MSRSELLDLYFFDARSKLIDIAAFLDRVERAEGRADARLDHFREALGKLIQPAMPGQSSSTLATRHWNRSMPPPKPRSAAPGTRSLTAFTHFRHALHRTARPHGQSHDRRLRGHGYGRLPCRLRAGILGRI